MNALTLAATALLVFAQGGIAWGLRRQRRWAAAMQLLLALSLVVWLLLSRSANVQAAQQLEGQLLASAGLNLLLAALLVWRRQAFVPLAALVWFVNSLLCGWLLYLLRFFQLF